MKKYRLYKVSWRDAASSQGWQMIESHAKHNLEHVNCTSVGWIINENKDYIVLAGCVTGGESNRRTQLPKKWIQKKTLIKGHDLEIK